MDKLFPFDCNKDNKIQCNNENVSKNERSNINSIYQKALQKIECDSKNKPCCCTGIIGPTGPTGPTGATGTSQIIGMSLVTTTSINSILTLRNPADNAAALTITPLAGGTEPVSAHLVILQIQ